MSASQIPNLLTSRGGPRLRGRARGRGGTLHSSAASRKDQAIQSTDTDAAVSRLSAVSLGYLEDSFAQYFVQGQGTRRLPIINRGLSLHILSILPATSPPAQVCLISPRRRNIHAHQRSRYPRQCFFSRFRQTLKPTPSQTDRIARGWHRHAIFPPSKPEPD